MSEQERLYFKCMNDDAFYYLIGLFSEIGLELDFESMVLQNKLNPVEKVVILTFK